MYPRSTAWISRSADCRRYTDIFADYRIPAVPRVCPPSGVENDQRLGAAAIDGVLAQTLLLSERRYARLHE
jgi:hypothetical protein